MNWLRRLFCSHAYRLSDMSNDGRMREWTCDKCGKVKVHIDFDEPKKRTWIATGTLMRGDLHLEKTATSIVNPLKKTTQRIPEDSPAECDCPGDEGSCAELPNCRFKRKA